MEEIVELLMLLGHWARVDLERTCEPEEYVAHEVLFLRALFRLGEGTRAHRLATFLGWTKGRVSQVTASLVKKGHVSVARGGGMTLTHHGFHEGSDAFFAFAAVGERLLADVDDRARAELIGTLRKMRANVLPRSAEAAHVGRVLDAFDG